ncbi:hypothetical protein QR680_009326 [Steinernema hermaphroditum]|uniref:ATP-dependent DNA helicase n=1 Tax=Steinernema hermaphroditum TaxID=289476 RepID=A0AA39IJX0_9BILA|nr:hypothetical protein QR680_009326 [Steinernema hermaphroditum]
MKKTVRLSGLRSIDCFAHQLQLAVYSGLRKAVMIDFDGVLERIKKFIRKLRKSGVERQEFIALQQLEEIPPRWLKKGIEVRWNALHDMIERFLENKAVIDIFCMDKSSFPKIAPAEYLIMQKMVDSLQPIKKATVMLQGRNVTISSVIPTIFVLRRALNDCGTEVSTAILLNLEERVEGIEENADYVVATLLDPKFKADFIEEPQQVASRELLKTKAEKMLAVVLAETTKQKAAKDRRRKQLNGSETASTGSDGHKAAKIQRKPVKTVEVPVAEDPYEQEEAQLEHETVQKALKKTMTSDSPPKAKRARKALPMPTAPPAEESEDHQDIADNHVNLPAIPQPVLANQPQIINNDHVIYHPMRALFAPEDVSHHYVDAQRDGVHQVDSLTQEDLDSLKPGVFIEGGVIFQVLLMKLDEYNRRCTPEEKVTLMSPEVWDPSNITMTNAELRNYWDHASNCTFLCRSTFRRAVVPINVSNRHWIVAVLDFNHATIVVYDSLRKFLSFRQKNYIHKSLLNIHRCLCGILGHPLGVVTTVFAGDNLRRIQSDGTSCGLYTIEHALKAIESGPNREGEADGRFKRNPDNLREIYKNLLLRMFGNDMARRLASQQESRPSNRLPSRWLDQYVSSSPTPEASQATPLTPRHETVAEANRKAISIKSTNNHRAKTKKYVKKSDIKKRPGRKADAPFNLATYKPDPLGLRSAALMPTKHKSASNTRDPNAVKNFCVHTRSILCPYCKDSYLFPGETTKFCCSGGAATVENVPNTLKFPDQLLMYFDRDLQKQKRWGDIQAQSIMLNSLYQMASTTGAAGEPNGKGKRTLKTNGDPVCIVQGSIQHKVSSILPPDGKKEQFAQVYCIDCTDKQTDRRIEHLKSFSGASIPREIIHALTEFISKNHKMAESIKMAYELYKEAQEHNQPTRFEKLIVLSRAEVRDREQREQGADLHDHQVLQLNGVSEVYIPDPDHEGPVPRGTWFQFKNDRYYLRELPFYDSNIDPLAFPLIFPGGEPGYGPYIPLEKPVKQKLPKAPKSCPLCDKKGCRMTIVDSSGKNYGFKEDDEIISADVEEVVADFGSNEDLDVEEPPATLDFDDQCADLQASEVEPRRTAADFEAHELCPGEIDAINAILAENEDEEPNFIQNQTPDSDEEEDAEEGDEVNWGEQDDYVLGEGDDEDEDMVEYTERIGKGRRYLSNRQFARFRMRRPAPGVFHFYTDCGRLGQYYIIDTCQRIDARTIHQMKTHFKMRSEAADDLRQVLQNRLQRITDSDLSLGKIFLLPYSYPGGKAYMQRKFLDAMAISARDIQCRVFLRKLDELKKDLKQCFGEQVGMAMSIEHQQRGMPHAHILLTIHPADVEVSGDHIDEYITTDVPDPQEQPELFRLVTTLMHHNCNEKHKCRDPQNRSRCTRGYPKRACPISTIDEQGNVTYRRDPHRKFRKTVTTYETVTLPNGNRTEVEKKNVWKTFDSRTIVPYNPYLLLKYGSHINVEYCSSIEAVRYIHKYIFKGSEYCFVGLKGGRQVAMNIPSADGHPPQHPAARDGIEVHYDEAEEVDLFRALSAHEAYLRIMEVQITETSHFVDFLPVHLEGKRCVTFRDGAGDGEIVDQLLKDSKLDAFFDFWKENDKQPKRLREEEMTYPVFAEKYRFDLQTRKWQKRKKNIPVIARVQAVPLHKEDLFAMRALLMVVRGPKSFEHLKGSFESYSTRAADMGLIESAEFWDKYLDEVVKFAKRPKDIRAAFARLVTMGCHPRPKDCYHKFKTYMFRGNISQTVQEAKKIAICDLERRLRRFGKSLTEFGVNVDKYYVDRNVYYDNLADFNGNIDFRGIRRTGDEDYDKLNNGQKEVVDAIQDAVDNRHDPDQPTLFELNGSGGTGKTMTMNTLIKRLIGSGKKVIVCASTGMAARLLISGRTVHSAFKVAPNRAVPNSVQSEQGRKIAEAEVIIWDEVTMSHRKLIDGIEQHCRDVLPYDDPLKYRPFGGKVILMSGDWKQLLPVVEGAGSPIEQLRASLKYSTHYNDFKKLLLTQNMRIGDGEANYRQYTEDVGTGYYRLNDNGEYVKKRFVPIHKDSHYTETPEELIDKIFPGPLLDDRSRFEKRGGRAILAAHNENVDKVNAEVLRRLSGESKIYDAIDEPTVDYSCEMSANSERTFIAVKPDGVQRGLIGDIIARFEKRGYKLVALKMMTASRNHLEVHYQDLKDKPFFPSLIEYMASGPVVAMVWQGLDAVKQGRVMLGATNPLASAPGTIRGDYCIQTGRNICHGSDSVDSANREIAHWFKQEEINDFESAQINNWVYE